MSYTKNPVRIGTAGWSIPALLREKFPQANSILERYSQIFPIVEINSSFHKPHQKSTYEWWAAQTPSDFQFSVKMPKQITHKKKLIDVDDDLNRFIYEISGLEQKLGFVLIQLPPSLNFDMQITSNFLSLLRSKFEGRVALEPRHISWGEKQAISVLQKFTIERVLADPVVVPNNEQVCHYYRLHGSPKMYYSSYDSNFLQNLAKTLLDSVWIIFDNTTLGAGTQNALDLQKKLQ